MTADLHPDIREVRPSSCCGACPPIAGGGWDCTCPGMPGCPANSPELRTVRERDAVAQDLAQIATDRDQWAVYLRNATRKVHALTAERDRLAARLAAVEAAIRDHSREYFSPARRIEAIPVDDLRAALAAPTDTTKEN